MDEVDTLVNVDWLRARRNDPNVVLLDASVHLVPSAQSGGREFRSGLDEYLGGHIPGARFADLFTQFSDPTSRFPFTLPDRAQFGSAAGHLGITPSTHVVIYDGLTNQWAARLWWVFRIFGHAQVSVLNGGFKKYIATGGKPTSEIASYAKADYPVSNAQSGFATTKLVSDIVAGERPGSLICLLQPEDFAGAVSVRPRVGHIPGSANVPFTSLIDPSDNTLLPRERLKSVLQKATPLNGELVVTYCGGGIASTIGALALALIGYEHTLEYDGSLTEWIDDPQRPMAVGAT